MCDRADLGSCTFLSKALADQSFRAFRKRKFVCQATFEKYANSWMFHRIGGLQSERRILLSGRCVSRVALARIKIRRASGDWISLISFPEVFEKNVVQPSIPPFMRLLAYQSEALVKSAHEDLSGDETPRASRASLIS